MMLRKRGADPRASWAFNPDDLTGVAGEDGDLISAVKSAQSEAANSLERGELSAHVSPTAADSDAHLSLEENSDDEEEYQPNGVFEAMDMAVDAAATQIVSKAMRLMSLAEDSPAKFDRQKPERNQAATAMSPQNPHSKKFDSTFLDKGLDAINGVGKLVEGFAVTLDNVIGQAFEDWGTPKAAGRAGKKKITRPINGRSMTPTVDGHRGNASPTSAAVSVGPKSPQESWQEFELDEHEGGGGQFRLSENGNTTTPLATAAAADGVLSSIFRGGETAKETHQWRRRAQILQKELQKLRAQRDEYKKVKEEYEVMHRELQQRQSDTVLPSTGEEESSPDKKKKPNATTKNNDSSSSDPLAAEQVMRQMEALLEEKARLAQENNRLARENTGLHELLEFTMQQHVADLGEDDLFDDGADSYEYSTGCGGDDEYFDGSSSVDDGSP